MRVTARKVRFASAGAGIMGVAAHDVFAVIEWAASTQGVPPDIAGAMAHIGTGLIVYLGAFASGWLTRDK